MKIINWKLLTPNLRPHLLTFLFTTPLLSARVYATKKFNKDAAHLIILKLILSLIFLFCVIFLARNFLRPLHYFEIVLISPMIYLFTEVMGALGQLFFLGTHKGIPSIHRHPLKAKSLGDFWALRWNFWVRDWLRDISQYHRKVLSEKLVVAFLVSGIFHELLVNLPHFMYYRESFFGNMTLYFIIQALGLWIEKKWMYEVPAFVGRIFLWVVVILPAPIFINRPLLIFFGILDE